MAEGYLRIWDGSQSALVNLNNAIVYLMGAQAKRLRWEIRYAEDAGDRETARTLAEELVSVDDWLAQLAEVHERSRKPRS
jgi:hypothetical protein